MRQHDYAFDMQHISYKANELNLDSVEDYALNLDSWLSSFNTITPEMREYIDKTIEFLYSLLDENDYSDVYDSGYEAGQKDCECECSC